MTVTRSSIRPSSSRYVHPSLTSASLVIADIQHNYYFGDGEQVWRNEENLVVLSNGDALGTSYHADFVNGVCFDTCSLHEAELTCSGTKTFSRALSRTAVPVSVKTSTSVLTSSRTSTSPPPALVVFSRRSQTSKSSCTLKADVQTSRDRCSNQKAAGL